MIELQMANLLTDDTRQSKNREVPPIFVLLLFLYFLYRCTVARLRRTNCSRLTYKTYVMSNLQ